MNTVTKTTQTAKRAVLEIDVNNHPGVMSHIAGLFSRRACNIEAILCMPVGRGVTSRIWLLLNTDDRLEQVIKQVAKLEDVYQVRRHNADHEVFKDLEVFFR